MDWSALSLSLQLAVMTVLLLLPLAVLLARPLAWVSFPGKGLIDALVTLPLLLPPTVLGFYLLGVFAPQGVLGQTWLALTGRSLVFSFDGLLAASLLVNIPFAVQPVQRAFEAIPREAREAAWCCGLSPWRTLWRVELPLAWPGLASAMVLTFVHTLGEFGVVLMVGGNLDGATRTLSIAIYDRVQAFDDSGAARMSLLLVLIAFAAVGSLHFFTRKVGRRGN
ncbi:MAG: molybdate ABC transporter permease subunit [Sulfuritalea sp.]|jgi:molybdate transport system permease protein|nr:molybdate ABC transporter permease subunit [Sulfuritalea sp.]